jgi:hypothetical protein
MEQGMGYGLAAGMGQGMGGPGPMGVGPMGYGPMGQGPMMGHGMGPHAYSNPGAAAESRLAGMKSELKITSAQESAWTAFAEQAKQQAEAMQAWMSSAPGSAQAAAPNAWAAYPVHEKAAGANGKSEHRLQRSLRCSYPGTKALADQHFGMMGGRGMASNKSAK